MTRPPRPASNTRLTRRPTAPPERDWRTLASEALARNDFAGAHAALREVVAAQPGDAAALLTYGRVLAQRGEIVEAAQVLAKTLRIAPTLEPAARALSQLLGQFSLDDPSILDRFGLKAALAIPSVARQPLVNAALAQASATPELAAAIAALHEGQDRAAVAPLIVKRTHAALQNDLLLTALPLGLVEDAGLERLLTALRATLALDAAPDRFSDRTVLTLSLALAAQAANNGFVWAATPPEEAAVAALPLPAESLAAGDPAAVRALLVKLLYADASALLGGQLDADAMGRIKPRALREHVAAALADAARWRQAATGVRTLAPITDDVSQRVARQYEAAPYPQWHALDITPPGQIRRALTRFVGEARLGFMDAPFDVLVAGSGTGQHAISAALAYGPNARVTALDLSAASLGYSLMRSAHYDVRLTALQGDILDLDRLEDSFDIIECVGVLHHMADWRAGWRKLLGRLKPGGLLYIGLYSAASRASIRVLRDEPGYPGPGCSDAAARAYRATLLARKDGEPGTHLATSSDFFALPAFRDLVLHESETAVTIAEIEAFLAAEGLVWHGFTADPAALAGYGKTFPKTLWPGTLAEWAALESAEEQTFAAMYRFWCSRAAASA